MPRLRNLKSCITTLDNSPIADLRPGKALTYKSALITFCELHKPTESGETLRAYDLGVRIIKAEDEIELTKEEIEFLMKITESSNVFLTVVVGRVYNYLKDTLESTEAKK